MADYKDLYEAESGLEFSVFVDDAQFLLDLSVQLQDSAADVAAARDRLQSWGGEAGPAARGHLTKISDRIAELAANLADGEAQTALSGLLRKAVHTLQTGGAAEGADRRRLEGLHGVPRAGANSVRPGLPDRRPRTGRRRRRPARRSQGDARGAPATQLAAQSRRPGGDPRAAQTWTDAFLQWFAAVDRTFRTACSTAATAVEEALRTMAEGYRVQLPDHFFAGIPLLSTGTAPGTDPSGGSTAPRRRRALLACRWSTHSSC